MRTAISCFLFLIILTATARAQDDPKLSAPFGLAWGISVADVKALGVELTETAEKEFGASFSATKLPKVLTDAQTIYLFFGLKDRLWRIAVVSRAFENDPSGSNVLARYDELATVLTEKYGKGKSVHQLYDRSEQKDFLMWVSSGRSQWYTNFDTKDVFIQLGVLAPDLNTGFWRILIEQKSLRIDFEKDKRLSEKGTL